MAYNVNLATTDLALARQIARTIRESSGGFPAVQALGMATADPNVVQVSTNLLDTAVTPLDVVFESICNQAGAAGVDVIESEVVGLVPTDVLVATAARHIKAAGLSRRYALKPPSSTPWVKLTPPTTRYGPCLLPIPAPIDPGHERT